MKNKLKIASFVFNPFTNDSRVLKEAISLQKHNYDVVVVAHNDINLQSDDEQQGIKIKRLSYLNRKVTTSKLAKLKAYIFYILQSIKFAKKLDILHCNDLNTLPIGYILKQFYNKDIKIVYDAHEYETEMNGLHGIQKKITKMVEKFLIKYVDATITVSDGIANEYVKLYSIEKPTVILNTPAYKEIRKKNIFRETFEIGDDKIIFLYQGSLNKGRGLELLLETFKELKSNAVLVVMGYGELVHMVTSYADKYKNIFFHEAVSPDILLDYTCSTDFGISTIEDTCLSYHYCLPNKMFEYIMAEVPVIISNLPEMKKVVYDNEVGVFLENNTSKSLSSSINQAIQLDKLNTLKNLKNLKVVYNWEKQEEKLVNLYNKII